METQRWQESFLFILPLIKLHLKPLVQSLSRVYFEQLGRKKEPHDMMDQKNISHKKKCKFESDEYCEGKCKIF